MVGAGVVKLRCQTNSMCCLHLAWMKCSRDTRNLHRNSSAEARRNKTHGGKDGSHVTMICGRGCIKRMNGGYSAPPSQIQLSTHAPPYQVSEFKRFRSWRSLLLAGHFKPS